MRILAIEASGPVAGCALWEDGTLTAEYSVQYKKKHSQSLVPMLSEMSGMVDLELSSIDFIAFAGLQPVRNRPPDLSFDGREKAAGLYGNL